MAIDPNEVKNVTDEAVRLGGITAPIRGNDVLETDPSQLKLESLGVPPKEIMQGENDGDLPIQLAGLGSLTKPIQNVIGRALSPKDNVFLKSQQKLEELQKNQTDETNEVNRLLGGEDYAPDHIKVEPRDVDENGFGPALDAEEAAFRQALDNEVFGPTDIQLSEKFKEGLEQAQPPNQKGLLDDFRAVGARGDAKIPDENDIRDTIQALSYTYSDKIKDDKRGEISLAAQRQLADLVGVDEERLKKTILGRQRGQVIQMEGAGLTETMIAARDLLMREIDILSSLSKKAEFGDDKDALAFRSQMEFVGLLQSSIKGSVTEIGRAMGGFRAPARTGRAGDALYDQDVSQLLEEYGGTGQIRDMAKAFNSLGPNLFKKAQVARNASKYGKYFDAFYEFWINALLSNPVTHIKNISGAMLQVVGHTTETYAAASLGATRRVFGGEAHVTFGDANAQVFGIIMSLRESYAAAGHSMATGQQMIPGSKIDAKRGRKHERAFSSEALDLQGPFGTAVDFTAKALTLGRYPTKLLEFEDAFFKGVAYRQSLYEQAYRTGRTEGLKGDNLATYIAEFVNDPPPSAIEKGQSHARYVTLQTNLDATGKAFQKIRNLPFLRYFVPFLKTPYNAFKFAFLDRTPLGLFWGDSRTAIEKAKAPGATAADKAAGDLAKTRIMMGSATGATVFGLVLTGQMTGGGPKDPGLRDAYRQKGWKPYSVKIGNEYYSYAGAEPFSSVFMMAADAAEAAKSGFADEEELEKVFAGVIASLGKQMTQKNFMQGFSTLVSVIDNPDRYGGNFVERFGSSIVPRIFSNIKTTGIPFVTEGDPVVRATQGFLDNLRAQIPGLSDSLPPSRNLAGQTVYTSGAFGPDVLSPIYSSVHGPNPKDPDKKRAKEAFEMFNIITDIRFNPSQHGKMFNEDVELGPKGKDLFHQYAGKRTLEGFKRFKKSSMFKRLYPLAKKKAGLAREELQDAFRGVLQRARARARADLFRDKSEVGASVRQAVKTARKKMMEEKRKLRKEVREVN